MLRQQEPTVSTLHLVANDMTDIMENLDTRELDIGDGEFEEFDGRDPNSTGNRNKKPHKITNIIPTEETNKLYEDNIHIHCHLEASKI